MVKRLMKLLGILLLLVVEISCVYQRSFLEKDPELKAKLLQWENEASDYVKKEIKILREGNAIDKGYAAVHLRQMGPSAKGAILALIETFRDRTALEWRSPIFDKWYREQRMPLPPGVPTSPAEEAAKALGKIGKEAVEPLIKALGDIDPYVRWGAAEALGKIDPKWHESEAAKGAVPFFIQALGELGDENHLVRWGAAYALGEIKDPRAVEPLIKALGDENPLVRWGAAEALGKIKDPRALEPLIKALGDKKQVRKKAAEALGEITGMNFGVDPAKWKEWWEKTRQQRE